VFFCRENELAEPTQAAILSLLEARMLASPIHAPRPEEPTDRAAAGGLVEELDRGIESLRGKGHSIVFAALSLKALHEFPELTTPTRVAGLRRMLRSLELSAADAPARGSSSPPDPSDEPAFARFVIDEYLSALERYLAGRGHHGFAGHTLTIGHALLELCRLGHPGTARKGLAAYAQFLRESRRGADLGGKPAPAPSRFAKPLELEYWTAQLERPADLLVSSHIVKYPYSLYALLACLPDGEPRTRALRDLYHLTAVS
jgi:hypothetical protein